jgi:hypothetical protein
LPIQYNLDLLDIPRSTIEEYLVPKDYYKPKIEIRNYYLKWNVESCGIPQKEINELKKFLTDAIPFFDTSYELLNSFEKAKYKDKYRLHRGLSPALNISYVNKHTSRNGIVRYELHMHSDGSTFIDRIEGIEPIRTTTTKENDTSVKKVNAQGTQAKTTFYLKWTLGELLFNRQVN